MWPYLICYYFELRIFSPTGERIPRGWGGRKRRMGMGVEMGMGMGMGGGLRLPFGEEKGRVRERGRLLCTEPISPILLNIFKLFKAAAPQFFRYLFLGWNLVDPFQHLINNFSPKIKVTTSIHPPQLPSTFSNFHPPSQTSVPIV